MSFYTFSQRYAATTPYAYLPNLADVCSSCLFHVVQVAASKSENDDCLWFPFLSLAVYLRLLLHLSGLDTLNENLVMLSNMAVN